MTQAVASPSDREDNKQRKDPYISDVTNALCRGFSVTSSSGKILPFRRADLA